MRLSFLQKRMTFSLLNRKRSGKEAEEINVDGARMMLELLLWGLVAGKGSEDELLNWMDRGFVWDCRKVRDVHSLGLCLFVIHLTWYWWTRIFKKDLTKYMIKPLPGAYARCSPSEFHCERVENKRYEDGQINLVDVLLIYRYSSFCLNPPCWFYSPYTVFAKVLQNCTHDGTKCLET